MKIIFWLLISALLFGLVIIIIFFRYKWDYYIALFLMAYVTAIYGLLYALNNQKD